MKKDSRMLEELRKGPLAGMDEDEFKMIQEDVKKFGFKGLSGYAKSTVQRAIRLMGGEINKAIAQRKAELEKHGDHDQSTHSPTGGAGKDIQDLSPSDQKTFTSRMSSAKDYQEQRKIIEEYKTKLPKKKSIEKHGDHDQSSHGSGNGEDDSEGEDSSEPKNAKPYFVPYKDDSEEEFQELDADDPKWMDTMDYPRKKK